MQDSHTTHLVNSLHGKIECHELADRLQTSLGRTKRVNVQGGKEREGEENKGGEVEIEGWWRGGEGKTGYNSP